MKIGRPPIPAKTMLVIWVAMFVVSLGGSYFMAIRAHQSNVMALNDRIVSLENESVQYKATATKAYQNCESRVAKDKNTPTLFKEFCIAPSWGNSRQSDITYAQMQLSKTTLDYFWDNAYPTYIVLLLGIIALLFRPTIRLSTTIGRWSTRGYIAVHKELSTGMREMNRYQRYMSITTLILVIAFIVFISLLIKIL